MANIKISDLHTDAALIPLDGDADALVKSAIDRALMARGGASISPVTKLLLPPIIAGFFPPPYELPSLELQTQILA